MRQLERRDPEAAAALLAQLEATANARAHASVQASQQPPDALPTALSASSLHHRARGTYDPAKLYALMAYWCHWTVRDCNETHFVTFFAVLREVVLIRRRENEAAQNASTGTSASSGAARRPAPLPPALGGGDANDMGELQNITAFAQRAAAFPGEGLR